MKKRIALLVYRNVSTIQGLYPYEKERLLAEEQALDEVRELIEEKLDKANPIVSHAPDSLQPRNGQAPGEPTSADILKVLASPEVSGEIPPFPAPEFEYPTAGSYRYPTAVATADVAMTYNAEGHKEA